MRARIEVELFAVVLFVVNGLMHIRIDHTRWARQASAHLRRSIVAHTRLYRWALLLALGVAIAVLTVQTALGAIQLNFFTVISNPTSVTLEWSTASEINVAGFDIQCKLEAEPDTAFHEIGFEQATGGPGVGALYTFPVTTGVVPGTSYCFRLKEVTTDGTQGDVIDRCGYGPNVTPTPGVAGAIPTFALVAVPTDAFGNPIPATPVFPPPVATDAFGNPILPTPFIPPPVATDAFGNPIAPTPFIPPPVATDAFGNPILPTPFIPPPVATDAFGNPIAPTPFIPPPVATDAFGNPILPTPFIPPPVATDAFGSPLPTPFIPAAAVTDPFGSPLPPSPQSSMAQADPYGNPLAAATDPYGNPAAATDPYGAPLDPAAAAQQFEPVVTPTMSYIVVTTTPTPAPVALAPVLTPLPTAAPTPAGIQLVSVLEPTSQNLMVMLLCLTFTGASAIGILGLITSVMYMRARSSQRDFYDRAGRRRY